MPEVVLLLLLKRFVGAVHVSSVVILPSSIIALLVCCCVECTVDCGCTSASEGFLCAFGCCCCFFRKDLNRILLTECNVLPTGLFPDRYFLHRKSG